MIHIRIPGEPGNEAILISEMVGQLIRWRFYHLGVETPPTRLEMDETEPLSDTRYKNLQ